jgi:hypothetical protein
MLPRVNRAITAIGASDSTMTGSSTHRERDIESENVDAVNPEDQLQQRRRHEGRNGDADHRQRHDRIIGRPILA